MPASERAWTPTSSDSGTRSRLRGGLIERRSSVQDERSVVVSVTDAGRELIALVLPGHIEVVTELLFNPLSDSQVDQLTELLTPVREQMLATPPRSATPRRRR